MRAEEVNGGHRHAATVLHLNPNPPDHFTIFDRNHVGLLWRILVSRGRSNESAGSA